jgi:hypothetical protein
MSVKLSNIKTNETAVCERADWTKCRDHNASKGWSLLMPSPRIISFDEVKVEEVDKVTPDYYNNFTDDSKVVKVSTTKMFRKTECNGCGYTLETNTSYANDRKMWESMHTLDYCRERKANLAKFYKKTFDDEISHVCTNCEEEYFSLDYGYCDNSMECTGADLYEVKTGKLLPPS